MSLRSPKHKFGMTVTFDEYLEGIGHCITTTSDDIEVLRNRAVSYGKACHVAIKENKSQYPKFDWVTVDEYNIKAAE